MGLLFLGNLFSALDRFVINYGIVAISSDLQLNASASGLIISTFFLGYAIMQIPGGWLTDKYGAKIVLFLSVLGFSIFTGLTGLSWSLASLLAIRFIFGLLEGSFFPAGAKTIGLYIKKEKRSRAMSVFLSALTVAGLIAPVLATTIMVNIGWRYLFILLGVCGLSVAALYWFLFKPKEELLELRNRSNINKVVNKQNAPLKQLFKNPVIWSLMAASFAYGFVSWGLSSWMPTYLVKERGMDLVSLGLVSIIPAVTSIGFFLLAGVMLDKVKQGYEKWIGAGSGIGLAILVFLMFRADTITGVIICQAIIPVFAACLSTIIFSLPLKLLPQEIGGSATGVINLGTQIAGFVAPLTLGIMIDVFKSYESVAWLLATFGVVCFIAFLTLNTAKPYKRLADETAKKEPVSI